MYKYRGIAYRQNPDANTDWLIVFVASAEEIMSWSGIPRKTDSNLTGFQRPFEEKRVNQAKQYFEKPLNQSPTSLIIGLHPKGAHQEERVTLELQGEKTDTIRPCELTINYEPDEVDLDAAIKTLRVQLKERFDSEPAIAFEEGETEGEIEDKNEEEISDAEEIDDSDVEFDDADIESDEEIELGRSLLHDLLTKLENDPGWCVDNREDLIDLSKPATIIDGQHRILGAHALEKEIPFAICAIFDCDWAEQVFQFTVVNYTQRKIPDQFITANAALTLTASELDLLRERLDQAGVKVIEYELMKVFNFDESSPFYELVNLTEKQSRDKMGYKTMVRIAKAWYAAKEPFFFELLTNLYPDISGDSPKEKAERKERWKQNDWGDFALDFWKVIKDRFGDQLSHEEGYTLWSVGHSQLIVAIVLFELQNQFFANLNQQDESFFEASGKTDSPDSLRVKIRSRAKAFAEFFPPDFFGTKWAQKSLSIGPGRKSLQGTLSTFVIRKGRYQWKNSSLVKGDSID